MPTAKQVPKFYISSEKLSVTGEKLNGMLIEISFLEFSASFTVVRSGILVDMCVSLNVSREKGENHRGDKKLMLRYVVQCEPGRTPGGLKVSLMLFDEFYLLPYSLAKKCLECA